VKNINDTYELGVKITSGKTSADYSTNQATAEANRITHMINSTPVLRNYAVLLQAIGAGPLFDSIVKGGDMDYVNSIKQAVQGLPWRTQGSNTPQEQLATKQITLTATNMIKEITGGVWDASNEQATIDITNGLFTNWQKDSPENTQLLHSMMRDPSFAEIGPKLKPEAISKIQTSIQNLVGDVLVPGFASTLTLQLW